MQDTTLPAPPVVARKVNAYLGLLLANATTARLANLIIEEYVADNTGSLTSPLTPEFETTKLEISLRHPRNGASLYHVTVAGKYLFSALFVKCPELVPNSPTAEVIFYDRNDLYGEWPPKPKG